MNSTADIVISRDGPDAAYSNDAGAVVATVTAACGDGYHVRLYFSPDDADYSRVGSRDAADAIAMRHALRFA